MNTNRATMRIRFGVRGRTKHAIEKRSLQRQAACVCTPIAMRVEAHLNRSRVKRKRIARIAF
ncbi:hypothetical protein D3872_21380 [Massilia cavernae]|uniref:Uncharacterized protein n=2 Tax=Massilia cavernae TaxID=2320864 RepID=A0A418XEJ3_9BURK|nr:hypothetical protein D3872_21380 [Massilia cavernae]